MVDERMAGSAGDAAPQPAEEITITLAGESVRLHADRALYWPRADTLVIADLHLGKADHFRRAGIALPRGGTGYDLQRLDALLERTEAARLLVLGDLVHGALPDAPWRETWLRWRRARPRLHVEVVAGNHDWRLRGDVAGADALGVALHAECLVDLPFVFFHDPAGAPAHDLPQATRNANDGTDDGHRHADARACGYTLSGHVHPVLRLPGLPRLPAFRFGMRGGVLPAFTAFSGGQVFALEPGERVFACGPGTLVALPAAAPPSANPLL